MTHDARVRGLGVSEVADGSEVPVVILEVDERVVPIYISADQAQSIQHALDHEPFDRPLTHDLVVEMIGEFGAAVDGVRIDTLAEGTFMAKIDGEQYRDGERRQLTFDARPSDAIAIALRLGRSITISEEVLQVAGRPSGEFDLAGG
jgi:bifunctional DNase/RNase